MSNRSTKILTGSEVVDRGHTWSDNYYKEVLRIQKTDQVVGFLFILSIVVGLLGNSSAVCYFWPRRRKTTHDLLYLAITVVDFLTVSSIFPLVVSLLNSRRKMLFANEAFCTAWSSVISFTAKLSMFLAMMICITRTLAMKYPNRPVKRSWVVGAIAGYVSYMVVFYLTYLPQGWHYGHYFHNMSSCLLRVFHLNNTEHKSAIFIGMISYVVEVSFPSLITFVCFLIGAWILMTRPVLGMKFRRVSVTITLFTAVFLVCNIPCLLTLIWLTLPHISRVPSIISTIPEVGTYYFLLMMQIFPVIVNAAINPVLYLLRMRGYQNWIRQVLHIPARLGNPANV